MTANILFVANSENQTYFCMHVSLYLLGANLNGTYLINFLSFFFNLEIIEYNNYINHKFKF